MDDDTLHDAFERGDVSAAHWNHEAHLRVAWILLQRHPFGEAVDRMREGILRLNQSHGVPDAPDRGYHETLTCAFMCAIWATIQSAGAGESSLGFLEVNPHLRAKTLARLYYSRPRMMSPEAKRAFVSPDLAPLPHPADWVPRPVITTSHASE